MDKSFLLFFSVPLERPKSVYLHVRQAYPKLRVMNQTITVWMCTFVGPCNLSQNHSDKAGESQLKDRAAEVGELSDWCGWDGWTWSILTTGRAHGFLCPGLSVLQTQRLCASWGLQAAGNWFLMKHLKGCVCMFIPGATTRAGWGLCARATDTRA